MLSLPDKHFSVHPITYFFKLSSEYVLKQEFKTKYVEKCVIFIENVKIAQRWGIPTRFPVLPAAEAFAIGLSH